MEISDKTYKQKYPEKYLAGILSQRLSKKGFEMHHWSYNIEHAKDIFHLLREDHYKLHRYMIYDQERKMYRTLKGVLLDTKESHLKYFDSIKNLT